MMNKTIFGALAFGALAFSQVSQAATFDFAYQADNVSPYEQGYSSYSLTDLGTGVTVTATASSLTIDTDGNGVNDQYFAYLDSGSAGLGVCKVLNAYNQCNPSSDDNATLDEVLTLSFSEKVTLNEISFVNGVHGADFNSNRFYVSIDGGSAVDYALSTMFTNDLTGQVFDFWLADQVTASYKNQFYINSITVPTPAPLALLALGLLGVYGASRKKKAA